MTPWLLHKAARRLRGLPVHPELTTPYSLRLAHVSIGTIIAGYVAASLVAAAAIAAGLSALHTPRWAVGRAFRSSFATLWGLENLFAEQGQKPAYYVLAGAASVLGVIMPLLLLGSFVYKLLRHDPVQWRPKLSIEDNPEFGAVLSARFYAGTSSALGDLRITVYARVARTQAQPRIITNQRLNVIYHSVLADESRIPYSSSGFPCTVRIPLSKRREADATAAGDLIDVQGAEDLLRANVEFMVIVSGAILHSGDSFVSVHRYPASDGLLVGQPQWVDAVEDGQPNRWLGWDNFENNAELLVFVYGPLLDREAMRRTVPGLRNEDGPIAATLHGWQRAWNTGLDPQHLPRSIRAGEERAPFGGVITTLGLRPTEEAQCLGALYKVSVRDLWRVDRRERDYVRTDVTGHITAEDLNRQATIITYVPSEPAVRLARGAGTIGRIRPQRYLDVATNGYGQLYGPNQKVFDHDIDVRTLWVEAVERGRSMDWLGWDVFDNGTELHVFVYGSMVNLASMRRTLPELRLADGPRPAYLNGWKRAWNCGSDPRDQPERVWRDKSGAPFTSTMTSLGLETDPGGECFGAVYRISLQDLPEVDERERDYDRLMVTGQVHGPGLGPEATVVTYVPNAAARDRVNRALRAGNAVLSRRYVELTEEGFDRLGPDGLRTYRGSTPAFTGRIETLTWAPAKPGAEAEAKAEKGPNPDDALSG
jgi:cation transport regulator ChaC